MESREQLQMELQEMTRWEQDQKDLWFWEKLGRLPFALLDRWIPKGIQEKIGEALNEIGQFIQTGGDYLTSQAGIMNKLQQRSLEHSPMLVQEDTATELTLAEVKRLPLSVMDQVADELGASHTKFATVQGATTGFGGLLTVVVDIPAMLGLSLKVLQEIAICYGYDPQEERERTFIVKCLQFASSDIVGKKAVLEELAEYDSETKNVQVMSQLQGWREVVTIYRDNFGLKKMFQLIPLAGALFGAFINRDALQQVSEAGKMMYRKRRILERLRALDVDAAEN
ncbi:EcsC family protein [Paenibacillus rigui]|uniref:EcsC family protein n=1 Tax=Paenibacillus rigui TaxID=554312 RepID=A0A229UWB9_9BACL|nr:EcsC family protein [Paenibacillus rigui]OXM87752.1 hypothetical protein CF651_01125 [Paenibacillus rigui]